MQMMLIAHGSSVALAGEAAHHWPSSVWTLALILASGLLYARGAWVLWTRAGVGRGVRIWEVLAFSGGLLTLAASLLTPLVWLSGVLFTAHMIQHELLMLVAAPLLALGQPLATSLWGLPDRWRMRAAGTTRPLAHATSWLAQPFVAFALHAAVLWVWHLPALYVGAMAHEPLHAVQHASFLLTAALFWWGMLHGRYGRAAYGAAVLYVFLTAAHSGLLGALVTLAPAPLYAPYATAAPAWGFDALDDQQLAGLIMWIPSALVFIGLGLGLMAAWLADAGRRVALSETSRGAAPGITRPTVDLARRSREKDLTLRPPRTQRRFGMSEVRRDPDVATETTD